MNRKNLVILGVTGSIGQSAQAMLKLHHAAFRVRAVSANSNVAGLAGAARLLNAAEAVVADNSRLSELCSVLPATIKSSGGEDQLCRIVAEPEVDVVLCGIVGAAAINPVLAALRAGKTVALATKEVLVCAGDLVCRTARENGGTLLPVDSEHSALFQCLRNRDVSTVKRLILTASGGAFRDWTIEQLVHATSADAMNHPTWRMGEKVTVDSATMMNKALELVEAHHLFNAKADQLKVVLHRESVVHSMAEFCDNSVMALMAMPDMQLAIQYALSYPDLWSSNVPEIDWRKLGALHFEEPDFRRFPALEFGFEAIRLGGTAGAVMNAADEVAVKYFNRGLIAFADIWSIVERVMAAHSVQKADNLEIITEADREGRRLAELEVKRRIKN